MASLEMAGERDAQNFNQKKMRQHSGRGHGSI